MKRILLIVALVALGCSPLKEVPVESHQFHNSIELLTQRDSIFIIPPQMVSGSSLDTLILETSNARSIIYLDTTKKVISGKLETLSESVYDRSTKEEIKYITDSVYVEVPVRVEVEKRYVPKWAWISIIINLVAVISFLIYVYFKFLK